MRFVFLIVVASVLHGTENNDLYPQAHALIHEAEAASLNIATFDDRSVPAEWVGHLYARAGYLEEAERACARSGSFPFSLLKAYVLYGRISSAEHLLARALDPYKKAQAELSAADVFWRSGQMEKASDYARRAKQTASTIADTRERIILSKTAAEELEYMAGPAPSALSPLPMPPAVRAADASRVPGFPITPDGFADLNLAQREERARSDGAMMVKLYQAIKNEDRQGIEQIRQKASSPFETTLAIASIEHLLIQAHKPEEAEQVASTIPESDQECILAKAEALSSAGSEWLRAGDSSRANTLFAAATKLAQSSNLLPIGQVVVLSSIGEAESRGGLTATAQEALRIAEEAAGHLPCEPVRTVRRQQSGARRHYRTEAYEHIFTTAIRSHDLATARRIAEMWSTEARWGPERVAQAWLMAGDPDEAIAFVHREKSAGLRAKLELSLAQRMLDQAGAPNI